LWPASISLQHVRQPRRQLRRRPVEFRHQATNKVWYYQLDPGRNLGKTNPLNDDDLAEFVKLQKTFTDSPKSWSIDAGSIDKTTFDLSVKNPNGGEEIAHRSPQEIINEIIALDAESAEVLENIRGLV
jgi:type I restriction enzyme M protein